jgi:hypothetical protein
LGLHLDTLGDDSHREGVGEVDYRGHYGHLGADGRQLSDEGPVDLDEVERELTQVGEGEIAGPEVVEADEATALTGYDLEVGGDSILGCGFLPPGSDVADPVVNAVLHEGDVASIAAEGFPNATDIIPVDVGEDTVAVTIPSGDAIASVITASGGRLVELAIVFLLIDPEDTARIEEAAGLAVTALSRWD